MLIEFYPSITEILLDRAISFAEQYVIVNKSEINIIKNAAKSVLYVNGEPSPFSESTENLNVY